MTVLPGIVVNGILYFCLEALSSLVRVGSSDSLTSIALPSRITTSSPDSRWIDTVRLCARLRPFRDELAVPKYRTSSMKNPQTGIVSRKGPSNSTGRMRGSLVSSMALVVLPMILGRTRIRLPAFLRNHLHKIDYAKAEVTLLP